MGKTIKGSSTIGVTLSVNPTKIKGTIDASAVYGIAVVGPATKAWTVVNDGTLIAPRGEGIYLHDGGKITNAKKALIAAYDGVVVAGQANISNAGTIAATGLGIVVEDFGAPTRITNSAGGVISGDVGIEVIGTGAVVNQGLIDGTGVDSFGAFVLDGTIDNAKGGTIIGHGAVGLLGAGTIIDAGLIEATGIGGYAVRMGSSAGNQLILQSGATVIGAIEEFLGGETIDEAGLKITADSFANGVLTLFDGSSVVGTLEFDGQLNASAFTLASDGHGGTDILLGTETFTGTYTAGVGLAAVTDVVASGARITSAYQAVYGNDYRNWTLTNLGTIIGGDDGVEFQGEGYVSNTTNGLIEGGVGVRIMEGTLVDAGTIIGSIGLANDGSLAAIYLGAGSAGVDVVLQTGAKLEGGIYGFVNGDTIDIAGVTATEESFGNGVLTLTNAGAVVATVALDGVFNSGGFKLEAVSGGTGIIAAPTETFTGHYTGPLRLSSHFTSIANTGSFNSSDIAVVGEDGQGWTLLNSGSVTAGFIGVDLDIGQITNATGGLISGEIGVLLSGGVTNAGSINGFDGNFGDGIGIEQFGTGSSSRNLAGGSIYGGQDAAVIEGGSFANAGTIHGPIGVLLENATFSNTARVSGVGGNIYDTYRDTGLFMYSGYASNTAGGVIGGSTGVTIDSGVLVNAGKILGLPGGYQRGPFGGTVAVDSKGLVLTGGTVTNTSTGTISGDYGVALYGGTLADAGTIASTVGGTGIAIAFGTAESTLVLDQGNVIKGAISNFIDGDVIDFAATKITADSFSNGIVTLINGGAIVEKLSLTGFLNQQDFTLASDGAGGTELIIGREIISGSYDVGINLTAPTTITKTGTVAVTGGNAIYGSDARDWTLLNQGIVTTSDDDGGVRIEGNANITNAAGALISGGFNGISAGAISSHVEVNNAGTILATGGDVNANAVFLGHFTYGTLINTGLISGKTGVYIGDFSTITNAGTIASSQAGGTAIKLGGEDDELILDAGAKILGGIVGFTNNDVIDFAKQKVTGDSFKNGTLTLTDGGVTLAALGLGTNYVPSEFTLASDGAGGTDVILGQERLTGTYQYGVTLTANRTTIASTALVEVLAGHAGPGNPSGYAVSGGALTPTTIVNDGRIIDTYNGRSGIDANGSTIINAAGATISGSAGIKLFGESGSAASIDNSGTIIGIRPGGYGIDLSFGLMSNEKNGIVTGDTGLFLYDATLNNAGKVVGNAAYGVLGISLYGVVDNLAGGTIKGSIGIRLDFSGTVTNAGTIESSLGAGGTAIKFGEFNDVFVDDPGGVLIGGVTADNSGHYTDLLQLASGSNAGTLSGIGETIIGFSTIAFDPKSTWTLRGDSAGFADGQSITGFSAADTIIIDNFSASSFATIAGGLVLKNGGSTITLDITTTLAGAFSVHAAGTSTTITAAAAGHAVTSQDIVSLGALSSTAMSFLRPEPEIATEFRSLTWQPEQARAAAAPGPQTESIGWILLHAAAPASVPMVTLHSA
jgi:hypothetical protein